MQNSCDRGRKKALYWFLKRDIKAMNEVAKLWKRLIQMRFILKHYVKDLRNTIINNYLNLTDRTVFPFLQNTDISNKTCNPDNCENKRKVNFI